MNNLIFLDVDGVLNCQLHYESKQFIDYRDAKKQLRKDVKGGIIDRMEYYESQICKRRLEWLNQLCVDTNAKVVISSSWRLGKTVEQLRDVFAHCGATFEIIDKTDYTGYERGTEISKWLKEHITEVDYGCKYYDFYNYVIIDDDSDMLLNQASHFFQTDNYSGLTPTTCYKIKRYLLKKTF
jgi:hypothetical protein